MASPPPPPTDADLEGAPSGGAGAGASTASGGYTPLAGKVAVVTGGGSGIGAAICELFASRGAHVFCLDLSSESAEAMAAKINDDATCAGAGHAHGIQCDVAERASVEAAFATVLKEAGPVEILVNNAGIGSVGKVEDATDDEFDRLMRVNVKGVYLCLQAAVSQMKGSGKGGAIVNLGSIASIIGLADRFVYSATKGAVLTMTYSVATDYVKDGIRCNCVCPARVHTGFVDAYLAKNYPGKEAEMFDRLSAYQPIGRMAKPAEVAALVAFLASGDAKFITGASYPIDGGVSCVM